jgi:hypothetical protein
VWTGEAGGGQKSAADQRRDIDRARQEEQSAGASNDLFRGHSGEVEEPAAGGERADAAAR